MRPPTITGASGPAWLSDGMVTSRASEPAVLDVGIQSQIGRQALVDRRDLLLDVERSRPAEQRRGAEADGGECEARGRDGGKDHPSVSLAAETCTVRCEQVVVKGVVAHF